MNENIIRNVLYYYGQNGGWEFGSFTGHMLRAYQCADPGNKARIRQAFPELAEAMDLVMDTMDGVEQLQARLKELKDVQ